MSGGHIPAGGSGGDSPSVSQLGWLLGPLAWDAISASTFTRPSSLGPCLSPLGQREHYLERLFTPVCVRCGGRLCGMRWVGGGRGPVPVPLCPGRSCANSTRGCGSFLPLAPQRIQPHCILIFIPYYQRWTHLFFLSWCKSSEPN